MGEGKENQADFITCTAWGKSAEFVDKYFFKGKKALIEGNIKTGSYDDKEGRRIYTTEIWVERIDFADDKKKGEQNGGQTARTAVPQDAPPWDNDDDFPSKKEQLAAQQQSVNSSAPPWMTK
jgi:single-strand DNA-binding protein